MKHLALAPTAIPRARALRRAMTPQERKLWRALRSAMPVTHWRKQVPMGRYTVDFACHSAKLIIEIDGGQHGSEAGQAHDAARTAFLTSEGYRVLRFWNNEVDTNIDGVLVAIATSLPLVGRDGVGARRVCATLESSPASENPLGAQTRAAPTQPSPQGGGLVP